MAGAVAGGLIAGLGITALLIVGERKSGQPSEIVTLERNAARKLEMDTGPANALPSTKEQLTVQGGHLMLSVAAGAVFAATIDEDAPVLASGLAFGAAFYAAMHWVLGPLLGVKRPEWSAGAEQIGMHAVNHLAFGMATAVGARLASKEQA